MSAEMNNNSKLGSLYSYLMENITEGMKPIT